MAVLKIADWEFTSAESNLVSILERIEDAATRYQLALAQVRNAIDDGQGMVASECEEKAHTMAEIQKALAQVRSAMTGRASAFISTVDRLDDFVYGG